MDLRKIKKPGNLIIFLMIFSFILNVAFVFTSPLKYWDETVYANLGQDLSENPLDYSVENNGWSDWIPSGDDPHYKWPKMGFRAPLLPYSLAILYLFNLSSLVQFFIPVVGALGVGLVYLLGKKMFNAEIGLYSALFFSLTPLYLLSSSKILTGTYVTFFLLLIILSFWKGYEEEDKRHKILFGFFFALALLARYTTLWFVPIFFIYLLIKTKSLKFVFDKFLWSAIAVFLLTLVPWFIYGLFEYGNILGAFLHGGKAAMYWGGHQAWHFYFFNWFGMFSVIGFLAIFGVIKIFYKKKAFQPRFLFLLLWTFVFIAMALIMPHKEERFILPIVPALCLISGAFISSIKKYRKLIFSLILLILFANNLAMFNSEIEKHQTDRAQCFLESSEHINSLLVEARVISDDFSVAHYYTGRKTNYYPSSITPEGLGPIYNEMGSEEVAYLFFPPSIQEQPEKEERYFSELELVGSKVFNCSNGAGGIYALNN